MLVIAFGIALTLIVKLYCLVVRWLFVSRNSIEMPILGVVGFKSLTLTAYFTISWMVHQKHIQLYVSCIDQVIYHDFRVSNIFHPLFCLESQIMPLGNFLFKKVISEVIAHLHNFFMMLTKGDGENPINNTLNKTPSAISSAYKRATGVCILPWLYNNHIKPSQ